MKELIVEKLKELEAQNNIRVLFACEAGSRAWGFSSPDSDHDVRFLYANPSDWYFSLFEENDSIEQPINGDLDLKGWDIRKTLRLVHKHNSSPFEWIQSPIIYMQNDGFAEEFIAATQNCFAPESVMHHYLGISRNYLSECSKGESVKLAKYFYSLRTALAAKWIADKKSIPPMELSNLLAAAGEREIKQKIQKLVELKAGQDESHKHSREPLLEAYLEKTLVACEKASHSLPPAKPDNGELEAFFKKCIK